ncbi:uncharacterized protein [Misgurnus anguillicaudatus]|uniref:uncharacterized protein n=1 Tax=Misgurnus anguillicaudatus TaxID=75329 RepID=UPI003CCF3000
MSSCSFQTQLMSIMELLAKAAISEIHRHVDDNCAFMRVELSRSRKDIDALKRKCVMMESELRRVKGRAKRRVWISGTLDRYPTPLRTGCVRDDDDDDVIRDEDPEPILNIHQVVQVLDDKMKIPVIKQERDEEERGGAERDALNNSYNLEQNIQPQENMESQKALSGDPEVQNTSCVLTQTYAELVEQVELDEGCRSDLGLHVKVERDIKEEGNLKTEGSESSMGPGDHLRYELVQRDAQLWPSVPESVQRENTERTFSTSIFSQPDHRTQMEPQKSGEVNAEDQDHPTWCGEGTQELGHMTHCDVQSLAGVSYNMLHESNMPTNVFPPHGGLGELGAGRKLRTHRRSSVDAVKRFSCSFCEKSFKRFDQLKEHLRSHTGEKPYTCIQCGRSFTKHCNLIRHTAVHSGEKPFLCIQCGKSFTRRSSLKSHQRIHSDDDTVSGGNG